MRQRESTESMVLNYDLKKKKKKIKEQCSRTSTNEDYFTRRRLEAYFIRFCSRFQTPTRSNYLFLEICTPSVEKKCTIIRNNYYTYSLQVM